MTSATRAVQLAIACASTALLVACTSAPVKNERLELARAGFERLSADVDVNRYSKKELGIARASLTSAEKVWLARADAVEIDHRAYIALSDIEIAKTLAAVRSRETQIANLELSQRDAIVRLRSAQAAAANSAAQQARDEAARLMAETEQLKLEAAERESQLQAQLDELKELRALQARSTDRGMVLTLGDLLFDIGKSTLKPGAISDIDEIATFMQKHPAHSVVIEGHTDDTGDEDSNRELSLSRAKAIGGALEARGVDFTRIETIGVGEDVPVASNDTAVGRQLNRRVEIIFPNNEDTLSTGPALTDSE
jgi:outer membrane protein OmpA-like peptidoglycan-associated protein